jgi:putative Mg2+ transporter-C (MgtC) family protein
MGALNPPDFGAYLEFIVACLMAVACGAIIGLERESKGKPAGLRTLVLISLGSCIFVDLSILISGPYGDPGRIAAQIVTGIGFLGAGAILQKSESGYIAGLTTAASIWVTAAVGAMVGAKHYIFGITGMIMVVICLRLLRSLEGFLFYDKGIERRRVDFQSNKGKTRWVLLGILENNMLRPDEYSFGEVDSERAFLELAYNPKNRNHRQLFADMALLPETIEMK